MGAVDQARFRAARYYEVDESLVAIVRVESTSDPTDEVVRLLTINTAAPATGQVAPLSFNVNRDGVATVLVAEVTPNEFQDILCGRLALPEDWTLAELIPHPQVGHGRSPLRDLYDVWAQTMLYASQPRPMDSRHIFDVQRNILAALDEPRPDHEAHAGG